jgi:hypothetical protein
LRSRPAQYDCQIEPTYPDHETVVFAIRFPDGVCHLAHPQCSIEAPHLITECGRFLPARGMDQS